AWTAPGGPEIHHDHLAAMRVKLEWRAVQFGQRKFQRVADARVDVRRIELRQTLFALFEISVMRFQQTIAESDLRPILRRIELTDLAPQGFQIELLVGV